MRLAVQGEAKVQTTAPAAPPSDLVTLRQQLAGLEAQQAGLQAEATAISQQLKIDKGPASSAVQVKASEVALQIAHIDGVIAQLQAQIASTQGEQTSGTTQTPPYKGVDPDIVYAGVLFTLAFPIVIAFSVIAVRRFARGGGPTGDAGEVAGRLERLEHAVDTIAVEVERISEGQRFVTKILSDQPAHVAALAADPNRDRDKVR